MNKWLTVEQAAEYLQMSESFIYKKVRKGKIPAHKLGQSWRLSRDEIDEWVGTVRLKEKKSRENDRALPEDYDDIRKKLETLSDIYYDILQRISKNGKEIMVTDRWLTIDQVAEYLQISNSSVYKKIKAKKIPAHKIGKQWRFSKEEVNLWVKSHATGSKKT